MSKQIAIAVHLALIVAGAANQYLIPVFSHLSAAQLAGLTGFFAVVFQGIQMAMGVGAYELTPSGEKAGQSTIATRLSPAGDVVGVTETHTEPVK